MRPATTASATAPISASVSRCGALGGRGHHHREDPAGQVRAAGRGVVVGGVVQRLDRQPDRLVGAPSPGRYLFFSADLANSEPEPIAS